MDRNEKKSTLLAELNLVGATAAMSVGLLAYTIKDSPNTVEALIQELRVEGHIILDNARGYWLCKSQAEYEKWRDVIGLPRAKAYIAALSGMANSAKAQWEKNTNESRIGQ